MPESTQPTVVLVHGAFADASGFGGVIRELTASGHRVLAPPNPLRGLAGDAAAVSAAAGAIDGTVVLVGHSYGGAVITQASAVLSNDKHLVSCQQRVKTRTGIDMAPRRDRLWRGGVDERGLYCPGELRRVGCRRLAGGRC
jgi:pimeloyl-ACP methyl ester carboxylesterase